MKIAILEDQNGSGNEMYIDSTKIENASLQDCLDTGWTADELGLTSAGHNASGTALYTVDGYEDDPMPLADIDIDTGYFVVAYWNGNSPQKKVFENYEEKEGSLNRNYDRETEPLYAYHYDILFADGTEIAVQQSNMSGGLSPFFYVSDEY